MNRFTLTTDHVALLRDASVCWNDFEIGAPTIDPKRPYGNGDVWQDVCRILGWHKEGDNGHGACWSSAQIKRAKALHRETETALQVVLTTGSFEPGEYVAKWYRDWTRVKGAA